MKPSSRQLLLRLGTKPTAVDPPWNDAIRELVEAGFVVLGTRRNGARTVSLTPEGRKQKAALRKTGTVVTAEDLQALEERLLLRVTKLLDSRLALLEPRLRTMPPAQESGFLLPEHLSARVLGAIQEIDQQERLDGIVPLKLLREHLADLSPARLEGVLLELERQYQIDLKIANDPSAMIAPESGLRIPGRGLAYFVALR